MNDQQTTSEHSASKREGGSGSSCNDLSCPPCCVVSYDYDYGWILEVLTEGGEYEFPEHPYYGHNDDSRAAAMRDAERHATEADGPIAYFYETPEAIQAKRKSYCELRA